MAATVHNGSKRDVLLLLDSPGYVDAINELLVGAGTVVTETDVRRPLGQRDDREYELPEFCREYMAGRFDLRQIEEPHWWIAKRGRFVRTPNFDLLSTATVCGAPGVLLVEAKAHHGELEIVGKRLKSNSSPENHRKIGESIDLANQALNDITQGFTLSRDSYYQVSNRVSWGWRVAALGVPVTLLYLGFVQDPYWPDDNFRSPADWLNAARSYLGKVVPAGVIEQRMHVCSQSSLVITVGALPAVPTP
jgi:hypothetical protein